MHGIVHCNQAKICLIMNSDIACKYCGRWQYALALCDLVSKFGGYTLVIFDIALCSNLTIGGLYKLVLIMLNVYTSVFY